MYGSGKGKITNLIYSKIFYLPCLFSLYIHRETIFNFYMKKRIHCQVIEEIEEDYYKYHIRQFMKKYYVSPDSKKQSFILFSGNGNKELAQEVAKDLKASLGKLSIVKLNNGESSIKIHEKVNNKNIIIIQSLTPPINDNLIELLFLISALKRESAKKIIVLIPYFAYSRTPLPTEVGKIMPYSSTLIVRLLEGLGADQIIGVDLHTNITGFAKSMQFLELDMVYLGASYILEKISRGEIGDNPVIVSPDVNGTPRARKMKDILELSGVPASLGCMAEYKEHGSNKNTDQVTYIGEDVKNKDVLIVDDMIHTGSKLISCVKELRKMGAGNINAFITHNLLYTESFRKVESLPIDELITTNTIANNFSSGKITTLSISKMISKYIEELLDKLDLEHDKH